MKKNNRSIFWSKWVSLKLFLFAFGISINIFCQPDSLKKKYSPIPIHGFYDSSHHWYDIKDEERAIDPLPNQQRYKPDEILKIADNILLYQKSNGGWPKNYDMLAVLTDDQRLSVLKTKKNLNTTFDNGATHSHLEYLIKVYAATKIKKYKDAILNGLKFVLSAQYQNGGWPQYFPDRSGYRKYITFNDGAMIGIMNLLKKIVDKNEDYTFIDQTAYSKIKSAFENGLNCIIKCQIKDIGQLLVWCQQHDDKKLKPQNARTFEPACICNGESADIVSFMMSIENPNQKIIASIQNAVKWFNQSKIFGIRVQEISAPNVAYQYHSTSMDRIIVEDAKAPPIWARYYELETHRPLFCNRDGIPVYSLAEVDRERRTGYGWYTYAPQDVLNKYLDWQKKWAPNENVIQ